jgi:DNA-binding transcriptional MerR regulator
LWSEGYALSHANNLHEEKMASFGAATAADVTIDTVSGNDNDDYARIGDVSEAFGVTLRTLRFYEDKGLIHPKRQGVTRLYSRRDRARIKLILLGKKVGFSLREVKQMIDLYEPGGSNTAQMKVMLEKSAKQLEKMKAQRLAVDEAIDELVNGINLLADRLGMPHSAAA